MTGHMSGPGDDLSPWNDDPLVRALRGPGTADELASQDEFMAAFRSAQPTAPTPISAGRLRRAGRRVGGGGTAVVVVLALGAGAAAAAAYTQNLPDPVQRAVHGVLGPVGVPAPEPTRDKASREPSVTPPSASDLGAPSGDPSSPDVDGESPSDSSSSAPTEKPSESPSETPTNEPTESPTPTPTPTETPAAPMPSAVSLAGTTHRAGPDEQVPPTGAVPAADPPPVPGQEVSLQQRVAGAWTAVGSATSDSTGAVSLAAPSLARTSAFRLAVGDLTSTPWRVVLVPTIDAVSSADGGSTAIAVTARGGQQGDRVELLRRRPGDDVLVARARLAADLSATFRVAAPKKRVTYVARLPRTKAHARARDSVLLQPLTPVAVSAAVPDGVLGPRDTVTVSGTVTADGGVVLPGRQVSLLLREPGGDWRRLGSATSDASGSVAIAVGPIDSNVAVRLRAGKVRSAPVPLRLQPEWTTSVSPSGDTAVVNGTVAGGNAGDTVLLRQLVDGRLVTVRQVPLTASGSVRFEVPVPEGRRDRYRIVLERTKLHLRAIAPVVVPPARR